MTAPPNGPPALAFDDLRAFDPKGGRGGGEKRYLCPFCGADKPRDFAHRSLSVNGSTGAWVCHRCGERGLLRDHWTERAMVPRRARARAELDRWATVKPEAQTVVPAEKAQTVRELLTGSAPLAGTPGAAYLAGRGIGEDAHDTKYHPNWYGRGPAVVFAVRNREGKVVAATGRFLSPTASPKTMTAGPKKLGLYATAGAFNRHLLVVVEAPIDALSLAIGGVAAVAMVGTSGPDYLPELGAWRQVILATDADAAGDRAADEITPRFRALGAIVRRLRPPEGKDWNDALCAMGGGALANWLVRAIDGGNDVDEAMIVEAVRGKR